jgi:hypothetical protein
MCNLEIGHLSFFVIAVLAASAGACVAFAQCADRPNPKLKAAVDTGRGPMFEIDDHARRVFYAEFHSGVVDNASPFTRY